LQTVSFLILYYGLILVGCGAFLLAQVYLAYVPPT
jgi:hypothetical protein